MIESADIRELAVAVWRLEKWLDNLVSDRKMAAKSALRTIKKYLSSLEVEVIDPLGSRFDPGLAVDVINNENEEAPEESLIIIETLSPYIYQHSNLIQNARVIVGTEIREKKTNREIITKSEQGDSIKTDDNTVIRNENRNTSLSQNKETESDVSINQDEIERMMRYAKIL